MKISRTAWAALLIGAACNAVYTPRAEAQTSEALMDALVRKGILTEQEAEDIKADVAKENRQYNKINVAGKTVTGVTFSGDFRGRYENFFNDNPNFVDRSRFRYRLRAGATMSLLDDFEVGFRLGSGDLDSANTISTGIDPISQNQTFQNNASKKGIFLDLAYANWKFLRPAILILACRGNE